MVADKPLAPKLEINAGAVAGTKARHVRKGRKVFIKING
jgi:hypothetical protein